jgi:uncharacterized protein (DUF1697 family)
VRCALLLRAVNVGGHGKLPMADLRRVLEGLGHRDVQTYLQSGNATLDADLAPGDLARQVENALHEQLGLRTEVIVRTGGELAAVLDANPFPDALANPSWLLVTFLRDPLPADVVQRLDPDAWRPDRFAVLGREVYQAYAAGSGRSRMATGLLRGLPVVGTARNWNTVVALAERTSG